MPWPGNEASPWIRIGTTTLGSCDSSRPLREVWSARALPSITGFTYSRWLGLDARVTVTSLPSWVLYVPLAP